jgi:hypothetical protein
MVVLLQDAGKGQDMFFQESRPVSGIEIACALEPRRCGRCCGQDVQIPV